MAFSKRMKEGGLNGTASFRKRLLFVPSICHKKERALWTYLCYDSCQPMDGNIVTAHNGLIAQKKLYHRRNFCQELGTELARWTVRQVIYRTTYFDRSIRQSSAGAKDLQNVHPMQQSFRRNTAQSKLSAPPLGEGFFMDAHIRPLLPMG